MHKLCDLIMASNLQDCGGKDRVSVIRTMNSTSLSFDWVKVLFCYGERSIMESIWFGPI